MSRRRLLGLAGAAAIVAVLPGCTSGTGTNPPGSRSRPYCVARSTLDSHNTLAGLPMVYEINQRKSSFSFEPAFYDSLEGWLRRYVSVTASTVDQVWSYGGWTDGGSACDSWHNAGRAFDLSRLRLDGGEFVSCRYDQWRDLTGAARELSLRRYWSLAASLHLDFAYVLTYLYNDQHANHIHIDNGRSGAEQSTLSTRSEVQVQAVQAICSYLWDEPAEITGSWDSATQRASRRVLEQIGVDDDLDGSVEAWRAFLTASAARSAD